MRNTAYPLLTGVRSQIAIVAPWRVALTCALTGLAAFVLARAAFPSGGPALEFAFQGAVLCCAVCVGAHTLWSP